MLDSFADEHLATPLRWQRLRRFFNWQLDPANNRLTMEAVPAMRQFTKPVLILWGEQDTNFGRDIGTRLAQDIPGTLGVAWMPESAHLPMLEQPELYGNIATRFFVEGAASEEDALHSSARGLNSWDSFGDLSLIGATILSGLLAGIDLNRVAVEMHAWEQVGATGWAAYSQHADLANGLYLYPFEAIGAALLTMGAIGCFHVSRVYRHRTLRFLYAALALSVVGLLLTMKAAPIMLGFECQRSCCAPTSL